VNNWYFNIIYQTLFRLIIDFRYHIYFSSIIILYSFSFGQGDPDPERFNINPIGDAIYIDSFEYWDYKNSFPDNAVLFIGSSSIRKWSTSNYFPFAPVINRGFGGSHISDIIYFIDKTVLKYNPKVIVLYAGDNDVASGKSAVDVFHDYMDFILKIHNAIPETHIIFLPIKPSPKRWTFWPIMSEINSLIKEFNSQNIYLHYVDTASPMLSKLGQPIPSLFISDSLHLSINGYDLWSETLEPILKKLLMNKN
tara:strand:- start:2646 stop:3401 length:756 start_codon:yes stop_codon:yes gene_type:complete